MKKDISFIFDKPLHGSVRTQEFFDLLLMAAAFDLKVNIYFVGEGVFSLLNTQAPELLDMRNNAPLFATLAIYDIENLYIEEESLHERGVQLNQLLLDVQPLSYVEMDNKIRVSDHVFSF